MRWLPRHRYSHGCVFPDMFAYPTGNQNAETVARVIINIMTKHAYLPTTIVSDRVSAFVWQVIKKVEIL